jgi:pimeloyl-ACP methyl ester carboxylesterase
MAMTISLLGSRLARLTLAAVLVAIAPTGFGQQGSGQQLKHKPISVKTPPPKVRAGLGGRPLDATAVMSRLKLPVLVTHGAEDRNSKVGNAEYTASVIPGAKLSIYEGIGHSPFYEDAARFNTELAAFVRAANKP